MRALGSFRHDYERYREHEIERYKESIPREALLAVGDAAVDRLRRMPVAAVSDLVLCDEVDRIIARRLKLPGYRTWRRRHMAQLAEWRSPAHWGLDPNSALVGGLLAACDGEDVLVAGTDDARVVLFAAALGCAVTVVGDTPSGVDDVVAAAEGAGLGRRVCGVIGNLDGLRLDAGLHVLVCSTGSLARIAAAEQAAVVDTLQRATLPGGVHVVRTQAEAGGDSGRDRADGQLPVHQLHEWYTGWRCTIECDAVTTFVARKAA